MEAFAAGEQVSVREGGGNMGSLGAKRGKNIVTVSKKSCFAQEIQSFP